MKSNYIDQADLQAAKSWWNSLLGGKKRYLKEHSKLTNDDKIVRYWLANVKVVEQAEFYFKGGHTLSVATQALKAGNLDIHAYTRRAIEAFKKAN